jgi:hypothetical protein
VVVVRGGIVENLISLAIAQTFAPAVVTALDSNSLDTTKDCRCGVLLHERKLKGPKRVQWWGFVNEKLLFKS